MTKKNETLPIPALHSNGSGIENLTNNAMAVYKGLKTTLDAMRQNRPHGRDYYPLGETALKEAQDANRALESQIQAIADAYKTYILTIKYGKK